MTDPTTGFLAARRNLLERLDLDPVGWKIVLEIVVKAAPVRVAEVPIIFVDRELGVSKQSLGVFGEYLAHLAKLYTLSLSRARGAGEVLCRRRARHVLSILPTVIAAQREVEPRHAAVRGVRLHRRGHEQLLPEPQVHVRARARAAAARISYATYVGTNLAGLAVRMLTIQAMIALAGMDQGRNYVFTNFVGIMLATLVNFVGAKFFAFDPQRVDVPDADEPTPLLASAELAAAEDAQLGHGRAGRGDSSATHFVSGVPFAELTSENEGVNVTMARNIPESAQFFTRPSVFPGGSAGLAARRFAVARQPAHLPGRARADDRACRASAAWRSSRFSRCASPCTATSRLVSLVDDQSGLVHRDLDVVLAGVAAELSAHRVRAGADRACAPPAAIKSCAASGSGSAFAASVGGALVGLGLRHEDVADRAVRVCADRVLRGRSGFGAQLGQSAGLRKSVIVGGVGFVLTASAHLVYVRARLARRSARCGSTIVYSRHLQRSRRNRRQAERARGLRATTSARRCTTRWSCTAITSCSCRSACTASASCCACPSVRRRRLLAMIIGRSGGDRRAVRACLQRSALRAGRDAVHVCVCGSLPVGVRAQPGQAAACDRLGRALEHGARNGRVRGCAGSLLGRRPREGQRRATCSRTASAPRCAWCSASCGCARSG